MYEYLILILCFGLLILINVFLFKYNTKRKLNYYTDPEQFAVEMIQNLKPPIKTQFMNSINLIEVMRMNLNKLNETSMKFKLDSFFVKNYYLVNNNQDKTKLNRNDIVEYLRKISLVIALFNHKHQSNKEELVKDLTKVSNIVFHVFLNI